MTHTSRRALAGLAAAALAAACGGPPGGGGPGTAGASTTATTSAPTLVGAENIVVADTGRVQSGPTLSGTLAAATSADVRAQVAATVLSTAADVGQRVTRGQVLARLDDRTLRDAVLSARSAVRSAQTTADNARRELGRQRRLLGIEAVAQTAVESAAGTAATAEANLADARSRLTSAEQQLAYATVRAPIDGVVSARSVSAGSAVQVGGALFTVVDPTSLRLEASVAAEMLRGLRVGAPVSFRVRGYGDQAFEGRITRVSPAADPATRQVQVFAALPNPNTALVTGLFASGRVATEAASGVVVPAAAVDNRQAKPSVARVRGGRVEHVDVTLGLRDELAMRVLVAAGVARGDTLLTGSAQQLAAGTRVSAGASVSGDRAAAEQVTQRQPAKAGG